MDTMYLGFSKRFMYTSLHSKNKKARQKCRASEATPHKNGSELPLTCSDLLRGKRSSQVRDFFRVLGCSCDFYVARLVLISITIVLIVSEKIVSREIVEKE